MFQDILDPIIVEWHEWGHRRDRTPWRAQTARAEQEVVGHIEWQNGKGQSREDRDPDRSLRSLLKNLLGQAPSAEEGVVCSQLPRGQTPGSDEAIGSGWWLCFLLL